MAKHGADGLGYEIVKAVIDGEIKEPLTYEKIKKYCNKKGINAKDSHLRVILPNASANTHSPNYKKYFERVGRGEYVVLPEFKNQQRYYWLNVDSETYNWSFLDMKTGKRQEYSSLNPNGNPRKNERCFNDIKIGDLVVAYETKFLKAITTVCRVVDKSEEDNQAIVVFQKIEDYENPLEWDALKENKELEDCDVVLRHRGTLFELEKDHYDVIIKMLKELNTPVEYEEELYKAVKESLKDDSEKRKQRLESRISLYPDTYEIATKAFKRSADVIAEVLIRANGICERCGKEAPFKRKSDCSPYLEVHHVKRLADGGKDCVENATAICPNCHRELHFG
jgi:predicted HNH restriction endonuclease